MSTISIQYIGYGHNTPRVVTLELRSSADGILIKAGMGRSFADAVKVMGYADAEMSSSLCNYYMEAGKKELGIPIYNSPFMLPKEACGMWSVTKVVI